MECVGHIKTNNFQNIGMITCSSNFGTIVFQIFLLHIISPDSNINGMKVFNKVNFKYETRYDSRFKCFQINQDVKHTTMKIIQNNKKSLH